MVIFLDISGAFSNTAIHSLVKSLARKGIKEELVWWIHNLLSERVAEATSGEGEISKVIDSGAPEGGISPLPLCSTMLYRREQRKLYDQIIHVSVMFLQMIRTGPVIWRITLCNLLWIFWEIGQTMMIENLPRAKPRWWFSHANVFVSECLSTLTRSNT